jgi:hypothetical protein
MFYHPANVQLILVYKVCDVMKYEHCDSQLFLLGVLDREREAAAPSMGHATFCRKERQTIINPIYQCTRCQSRFRRRFCCFPCCPYLLGNLARPACCRCPALQADQADTSPAL